MYHETNPANDPYKVMHDMNMTIEIPKLNIHKGCKTGVNSRHHQIVDRETLPEELQIIGIHAGKDCDHIEMIAHKELPIVGYQGHPEDRYNFVVDRTIDYLLEEKKSIL